MSDFLVYKITMFKNTEVLKTRDLSVSFSLLLYLSFSFSLSPLSNSLSLFLFSLSLSLTQHSALRHDANYQI